MLPRSVAWTVAVALIGCREVRIAPSSEGDGSSGDGGGAIAVGSVAAVATSGGPGSTVVTVGGSAGSTTGPGGDGGNGGGGTASASSGSGGDGGSGGAKPAEPCLALAWIDEPITVDSGPWSTPRLVALEDGKVGLVARDLRGIDDVVTTRVIEDPWSTWPPQLSSPIVMMSDLQLSGLMEFDGRADGAFALRITESGHDGLVGHFGEDAIVFEYEGSDMALVPKASGGAYLFLPGGDDPHQDDPEPLGYFPSLETGAVPVSLDGVPEPESSCGRSNVVARPDGSALVLLTDGCSEDAVTSVVRLQHDGATVLSTIPSSNSPGELLIPRDGGAWAIAELEGGGVSLTAIGDDGTVVSSTWESQPLAQDGNLGHLSVAPWRDGVVVVTSVNPAQPSLVMTVWDGVTETMLAPLPDNGPFDRQMSVLPGPDGRTFLVAHEDFERLVLRRARCVAPD